MRKRTTQAQLCREFRRYNLQILGLSEVRLPDSGERRTTTGECLLHSGLPETEGRASGVGFLLTAAARKSLLNWEPISDRMMVARFQASPKNVTFVQVYAPTLQADSDVKDEFYARLMQTLDRVSKSDIVIVLGDFNAKVGSDNRGWENVMGKHGLGPDRMNDNGTLFAELCVKYNLVIGGTLFPHKECHKATWVSPDKVTKNQIDHIAISRKWKTSLHDVRAFTGADVYSDHHLLVGNMKLKMRSMRRMNVRAERKLNIAQLKQPESCERFIRLMQEQLANVEDEPTAEARWNKTKTAFNTVGAEVLGYQIRERKEWISDHTWALIDERRLLKNRVHQATNRAVREEVTTEYAEMDRKVGRSARTDKRRWLSALADAAQQAADGHNMRETYRIAKRLAGYGKTASCHPVKSAAGRILTSEAEQVERWSEHFELVLNKPSPAIHRSPTGLPAQRAFNVSAPTVREITAAIKRLKNNKAPGADNISSEMLKVDIGSTADILQAIIEEVWEREDVPTDWKDGVIIKLPKKGNLSECTNWRGITLLNTVNKVISIILHDRISNVLEPLLRREQAGFRPGRSCTDHINTLRIIVEQSNEWQTHAHLLFIDFERAFDSLDRSMMWQILTSYGVPDKLLHIIQSMYRDANCRVVHCGLLGREFNVASGVKQGCILSPLLFLLVLDWVMKKTNNKPRGIQWGNVNMTRLEDLDFADDICLMANSRQELEEKLVRLVTYGKQVGLKVNVAKTKFMRINPQVSRNQPLLIEGEIIDEVENFCYLGSIIAKDGGADLCVDNRIQKARQAFGMLNGVWNSSHISRNLKMRFFKTNCLSVLLYGCETWKTTPSIVSRLQVFVNKCLRRIHRVHWPTTISNEELWRVTGAEKVEKLVQRRKWSWIGHTLRKRDSVAKEALDWNPQGQRRRGRPKDTWRRVVLREVEANNTSWQQLKATALNRTRWRAFVDALCSRVE